MAGRDLHLPAVAAGRLLVRLARRPFLPLQALARDLRDAEAQHRAEQERDRTYIGGLTNTELDERL